MRLAVRRSSRGKEFGKVGQEISGPDFFIVYPSLGLAGRSSWLTEASAGPPRVHTRIVLNPFGALCAGSWFMDEEKRKKERKKERKREREREREKERKSERKE